MARGKGPSIGGGGGIPTSVASDVPADAAKATSALEALEAQLRAVDRAMAEDTLGKQLAKATDPLKKQQAQLKLSMLGVADLASAEKAAARAAADASQIESKAAKQAAKEKKKADLAASFDRIGPLAKLSGDSFERLGGIVEERFGKRAFKAFDRMSRGWKAEGDAEHKTADTLKLVGAAAEMGAEGFLVLAGAALAVVGAVAGLAAEGASFALQMGMFKQNTEFAMKYALGSGTAATDAMSVATRVASKLGASVTDIAPQIQKLFGKGLGASESEMLVQVMEDVKAATGGRVDGAALGDAILSLKKNQGMTPEMLAPLREIGPGAQAKVFESLAASLGIQTANATQRQQQVLAQIGRLKGQKGMDAFSKAMLAATGKDKAGAVQKEFADTTVQGSFAKVKNQITNLFASIESGGAGKAIVAVFNKMANALDPTTTQGKKLLAILDKVASVVGTLFEALDAGQVVDVFVQVVGALETMRAAADTPAMQMLGTALKYCAVGAGVFAAALGVLVGITLAFVAIPVAILGALGVAAAAFVGWAGELVMSAQGWGSSIIDGLIGGITAMGPKVIETLRSLGQGMKAAVSSVLDMHSPSRVFMQLGRYTGEGMAMGVDQSAPMVRSAVTAMVTPTDVGGAGSGGGGSGSRSAPSINVGGIHIEVNGAGDAKAVGQEVTRQIAELFEQMGLQFGVVGPGAA